MRSERGPAVRGQIRGAWAVTTAVVVAAAFAAAGCSTDSEISVPAVQPVTTQDATGGASGGLNSAGGEGADGATTLVSEPNGENIADTNPQASATAASAIPGLDSTSEFCAAWSRFTGSYTLVAPAWAISLDPEVALDIDPAVIEVVASPTMVSGYFDLGKNWPAAISDYQEEGMDSYRPLFDRMNRSYQRLKAAGATEAQLAELAEWWEGQLASFNGDTFPTFDMVPTDLQTVVITAAEGTRSEELPTVEDPSLASDGVNAVYDYLATNCPDRGQLAGEGVADTVGTDEP